MLKNSVIIITLFFVLLFSTNSSALDIELKHSPLGQQLTCNSQVYRCYTFEEWKTLLQLDILYSQALQELALLKEQKVVWERVDKLQLSQITNLQANIKLLGLEIDRLTGQYLEAKKEVEEEKNSIWPTIYLVTGLSLATTGGLLYILSL